MKKRIRFAFFLSLTCCFCARPMAQEKIVRMEDAIRMARENSFEYKSAQNRLQTGIWRHENFKASFLPTLYMDGTVPNYSRAISKITLPTGEDTFVGQNQAYSSANLGIRQNVGLTGGTFSIKSSLNRLDVFGNGGQTRYSATPFSMSYSQNAIGYNSFKWQKKIEPLQMEASNRQYASDMERIANQAVAYFFSTLSAKARYEMSQQNIANADTLYRITQDRFKLGNIAQSSLLQLKLNTLNARKQLAQDSVDYILAKKQLAKYLRLPDGDFGVVLEDDIAFFDIPYEEALHHANSNGRNVVDFRLQRLNAEQEIAQTKAQSGLKFDLNANFGMTNTARNIGGLIRGMENQQQVSVGFSLPIMDWGYARTQRQRAESNLAMVESEIEQRQLQIEQEIALYTSRWNLQQRQFAVAREARDIAAQNYGLEVGRFLRGNISINDLNAAQQQKDSAANAYIEAVRAYWELYYTLRRLTLYDFREGTKL